MSTRSWIEVEDTFITNQSGTFKRQGRGERKWVPEPGTEPTEAYLAIYKCRQQGRAVKRRRSMHFIRADSSRALGEKIEEFVSRDDVILIPEQSRSLEYQRSEMPPNPL